MIRDDRPEVHDGDELLDLDALLDEGLTERTATRLLHLAGSD
jgi:hypothetical protein